MSADVLKLNRNEAVFLLTKLGWGKANEKDNVWLLGKVRNIGQQVEQEGYDRLTEGFTPPVKAFLDNILAALTQGQDFEFVEGEVPKEQPPAKKPAATQPQKGERKVMSSSNGKHLAPAGVKMIPLKDIKANTAQSRGMGVIANLNAEGYGLFEKLQPDSQASPIWEMLFSDDKTVREFAIDLLEKHEPDVIVKSYSIQAHGQLEPIGVLEDDGYDVIFGMLRALAMAVNFARDPKKAPDKIEAKVFTGKFSETELLLLALAENADRKDESPMDKALTYKKLRDAGVSSKEIGERTHQSQQTINLYLRLLHKLLEDKWAAIHSRAVSMGRAIKILERRQKGAEATQTERNGNSRHRMPSAKGVLKIYEATAKPKGMTAKDWEMWTKPDVRRFLAHVFGFRYKEFKPEEEMAGAGK